MPIRTANIYATKAVYTTFTIMGKSNFFFNSCAKKILWILPHLKCRDSRIPGFGLLFKNSNSGLQFHNLVLLPMNHHCSLMSHHWSLMSHHCSINIYSAVYWHGTGHGHRNGHWNGLLDCLTWTWTWTRTRTRTQTQTWTGEFLLCIRRYSPYSAIWIIYNTSRRKSQRHNVIVAPLPYEKKLQSTLT